ncbi:hypothetical protein EV426DRAFT_338004 [Tirmania nivea]|nr:hypothetical protein EV426DRAFT_338004 [Tirmania nivea]
MTTSLTSSRLFTDLTWEESIKMAVKIAAAGMMRDYIGNQPGQIPGRFVEPYYWWECRAAWGVYILYLQRVLSLMVNQ